MKKWRIKIVPREDGWHDYKYEEYDAPTVSLKNVVTWIADNFIGLLIVYFGLAFLLWGYSGGEIGVSFALMGALAAVAVLIAAGLVWWAFLAGVYGIAKMIGLAFAAVLRRSTHPRETRR